MVKDQLLPFSMQNASKASKAVPTSAASRDLATNEKFLEMSRIGLVTNLNVTLTISGLRQTWFLADVPLKPQALTH